MKNVSQLSCSSSESNRKKKKQKQIKNSRFIKKSVKLIANRQELSWFEHTTKPQIVKRSFKALTCPLTHFPDVTPV